MRKTAFWRGYSIPRLLRICIHLFNSFSVQGRHFVFCCHWKTLLPLQDFFSFSWKSGKNLRLRKPAMCGVNRCAAVNWFTVVGQNPNMILNVLFLG